MKALRLIILVASGLSGTGIAGADCASEFRILAEGLEPGGNRNDALGIPAQLGGSLAENRKVDGGHSDSQAGDAPARKADVTVESTLILGRMAIAKGSEPGCRAALETLKLLSNDTAPP